jgi:GR25 family glycosyltransferase involved in LPS biosynthesis
MEEKLPTYVINLDRDRDRFGRLDDLLSGITYLSVTRVPGVYGADLPLTALKLLSLSSEWSKRRGEIGCFLSHVKAWEAIAMTSAPFCLVLEDDAVPLGLDRVAALTLPDDADLVFINDRMSPGSRYSSTDQAVECRPLHDSLRVLNQTSYGVGADGYLLTPVAAAKLIAAVEQDGCFGNLDWRLLRYSLEPGDLEQEFGGTRVDVVVRTHHNKLRPPKWGILKAYCINMPLVAFSTGGLSSRAAASAEQ